MKLVLKKQIIYPALIILSLAVAYLIFYEDKCDNAVPASADMVKVKLLSSLERVTKFQDIESKETIKISGARNEWVSFQIAVRTEKSFIEDLRLEITKFENEQDSIIDSTRFIKYREHFIEIDDSSPESDLPEDWYPDPLIPFVDPETGDDLAGKYDAYPYKLNCGENAVYYIECQIPSDCPAGNYKGKVLLHWAENQKLEYIVELKVYDFSLPEKYVIASSFGVASSKFKEIYSANIDNALLHFENTLLDHRIQPTNIYSSSPKIDYENGMADFSAVHNRMSFLFDTLNIKYYSIPIHPDWPFPEAIYANRAKTAQFVKSYEEYFNENGWDITTYIYLIDEPKLDEFYKIHDVFNFLDSYNLKSKQLVTLHLIPKSGSWSELKDYVGIWCPSFRLFDDFMNTTMIKKNDFLWSYTALCQEEDGKVTPYLQTDFPLLNYRIPFWIMHQLNIDGLLYWQTTYWDYTKDPWQYSLTYNDGDYEYNGEGCLLYPGKDVGYWGLCTSLRLKSIRDGVEDYYLLNYADSLNLMGDQIKNIAKDWNNWNHNADDLQDVVDNLYNILEESQKE